MSLFTSESVTIGHPDKVADQISDAVLDDIIKKDPSARVACEVMISSDVLLVAGEITTDAEYDIDSICYSVLDRIGYTTAESGLDVKNLRIIKSIKQQSPDISAGVTAGEGLHKEQGAGDQGMMFGYATSETRELMPMSISIAHLLTHQLSALRLMGVIPYLRPDGKSQVTIDDSGDVPIIDTIVISAQHSPDVSFSQIESDIKSELIYKYIDKDFLSNDTKIYINPTGSFSIGGPIADVGLTGRKIIVDTYGGHGRHGGGAFSGKDPSKVDRSASYYCRYVAKSIVNAGLAQRCEIQVSYAIGMSKPVSIYINTFGTGSIPDIELQNIVSTNFDFTPASIISELDLKKPIYQMTAMNGHFGKPFFSWEKTKDIFPH